MSWVVTRRKLFQDIYLLGLAVTFFKYECLASSEGRLELGTRSVALDASVPFSRAPSSFLGNCVEA